MKWTKVGNNKWQSEDGKTIYHLIALRIRRPGRGHGYGGKRSIIQYYQYKGYKCRTLTEAKRIAEG